MLARTDITEFAVGALVGCVVLAAILHARGFRRLWLVGLACGALYALVSFGADGLISWTEDLLAMAQSHPTFFLGMAFGKFVQGVVATRPLRAARGSR